MFKLQSVCKFSLVVWLLYCLPFFNLAVAQNNRSIPIPDDIKGPVIAVLVLTDKGDGSTEVTPIDENGTIIQPCELCTKDKERDYGAKCEKASVQPTNICTSLLNATVHGQSSIDIQDVKGTPEYTTMTIKGTAIQVCKCGCSGKPACQHRH